MSHNKLFALCHIPLGGSGSSVTPAIPLPLGSTFSQSDSGVIPIPYWNDPAVRLAKRAADYYRFLSDALMAAELSSRGSPRRPRALALALFSCDRISSCEGIPLVA